LFFSDTVIAIKLPLDVVALKIRSTGTPFSVEGGEHLIPMLAKHKPRVDALLQSKSSQFFLQNCSDPLLIPAYVKLDFSRSPKIPTVLSELGILHACVDSSLFSDTPVLQAPWERITTAQWLTPKEQRGVLGWYLKLERNPSYLILRLQGLHQKPTIWVNIPIPRPLALAVQAHLQKYLPLGIAPNSPL
jgi:hypothetical protein